MGTSTQTAFSSAMPTFNPLDRATLQEQAYQQLRAAIMAGVFKPGTIITIRAAAEALGTSPMPARAALQRLEVEGALVAHGSKRTLTIPVMSIEEYQELVEIGVLLEGLAAERAAERITREEIAAIEEACHAMARGAEAGDHEAYLRANWAFHGGIYRASRMHTLVGIIERRWLRTGPYVPSMAPEAQSMLETMPYHWQALDAVKRGDGPAARQAIGDDLRDSAVRLVAAMQEGRAAQSF